MGSAGCGVRGGGVMLKRYFPTTEYIGSGEYIGDMVRDPDGEWANYEEVRNLLREALEAMLNRAPRIKNDRGGCFGDGGKDCTCTVCKIRREIE